MAELTDIGTILKQTVFDVAALSFTPLQEQAMRNNVIKAVQSAYVGLLGNASADQIAVSEVNKVFTNSTYTGSVTDTGFIAGDVAVSITVDGVNHTIRSGTTLLTNGAAVKAGIEEILDSLKVVYSYVLYLYTPPLTAGDKGVIFLQVVGCSSTIGKLYYTENNVSKNFGLSAVTLTPKVTYTDSAGAATYVETDAAKPLKVVGITLATIGAVTFSSPVVATNAHNVITAIREAIAGEFGYSRAVTFSYVIAAANAENSFVSCSVFGSWDVVESVQLLKNDVTAFDLTLTAL
jgi:hypothetical protein